jgi:alanyl-tRNA synthetase
MKLYGLTGRSDRIKAAAGWAGVPLEVVQPFVMGVDNKTPEFLAKNPFGKVPVLETPEGACIFESNAIARFLVSSKPCALYPADAAARAKIDAWCDAFNALDCVGPQWFYPIVGIGADRGLTHDPNAEAAAKTTVAGFMKTLEAALKSSPYLTGDAVTLADVIGACALQTIYSGLYAPADWKPFPAVLKWIETVYAAPEFVNSVGVVPKCEKAMVFDPAGPQAMPRPAAPAAGAATATDVNGWPAKRIRQTFMDFFVKNKQHVEVPSSPVVPHDDPTLLFANAGMNQFKSIFLGKCDPKSPLAKLKRACDTQKCIRAGGKHNDLDDVGKDTYHHTFFEMLGNWSFGDFFKREAIHFAWELLTEVYKLPADRLYATYFGGDESQGLPPDLEARDIWLEVLPASKVLPFGCADNFWEMGDVGPCGPCTEIHFDRIGGRDAADLVNMDDPMCLEIWNVVFIQFNREEGGVLKPLPAKHVDTGMGFERLASILQGKLSNYDTDIFMPIFDAIQKITGAPPYTGLLGAEDKGEKDMAYRVVADHIRTLTFAIADGAAPGSEGRNYVLRRVLRRAVRFGREKLGAEQGFFQKLVATVVANFGEVFPEIVKHEKRVTEIIADEEESFGRTLVKGIEQFKKIAAKTKEGGSDTVSGSDAFLLWESFGFPNDLTEIMAEEIGMKVDMDGFEAAFKEAQEKSRAGGKKSGGPELLFEAEATAWLANNGVATTDDSHKYAPGTNPSATVKAILTLDGFKDSTEGVEGPIGIVLDRTSFYAESGGQVADVGSLKCGAGSLAVTDTKIAAGFVLHSGDGVEGVVKVGDACEALVDYDRRSNIAPNHTMTHVLNYALRTVLGDGVDQKGSLVDDEKLRFDFSHNKAMSPEEIEQVEAIVREQVSKKLAVDTREVPLAQAQAISGLRAVFGEVYPDPVRVVSVGPSIDELLAEPAKEDWKSYSIEFCGGTHLGNTGEADEFVLLSEEGIAKGIRRVVGATKGAAAAANATADEVEARVKACDGLSGAELEKEMAALKGVVDTAIMPATRRSVIRDAMTAKTKEMIAAAKAAKEEAKAAAVEAVGEKAEAAKSAGAAHFVARLSDGTDPAALKDAAAVAFKAGVACALFACDPVKGKAMCYVSVPPAVEGIDVKGWLDACCGPIGGKGGGGKGGTAQGQGNNTDGLDAAVAAAEAFAAK